MRAFYTHQIYNRTNFEGNGHCFYHIKRVGLPEVKSDFVKEASIVKWLPYIQAAHSFLDDNCGVDVARQVNKLIQKIDDLESADKVSSVCQKTHQLFSFGILESALKLD